MSSLKSDILIAPSDLNSSSATQGTDLGARATTGDGRYFRYVLGSATALVAGKLYSATGQDTSNFQLLGVSVAAGTGTFVVTTGSTPTLFQNQLSGGLLTIRSSTYSSAGPTGIGYTYKIKSHPAVSAGTVSFILEDPLINGLPTTAVFDVTPNPYSGVIITPTTLTSIPLGVAVYPVAGSQYGWIQTRGLCAALADGPIAVGKQVVPSSGTAGALQAPGTYGSMPIVGFAAATNVADKYGVFFITID